MHGDGESYWGIVPTKQPNKSGEPLAEVAEGRPWTEENRLQPNSCRTPSRVSEPSGLERVREAARRDGKLKFTALLHHVTVDLLRGSYYSLKRQVAPGVDGLAGAEIGFLISAISRRDLLEEVVQRIRSMRRADASLKH